MAPRRRDKGTGSIYRDPERGGWKGELRLEGRRRPYVRRGKTHAEVADKLNRLRREHAAGTLALDQRVTVAEVVTRYVERTVPNRKRGELSPSSLYLYSWASKHIIAELGTTRAANLTRRNVEDALDRLAVELGRSALVKIRRVLIAALEDAVAERALPYNVARTAQLPTTLKRQTSKRSLTPEAARRLLEALEDEPNGALFAVMLRLGLRPGEAMGLYWDQVRDRTLTVSRAVQLDHGRPAVVDQLKTSASARTLDMPDDLVAMLERHRKRQAEARLAAEMDSPRPRVRIASRWCAVALERPQAPRRGMRSSRRVRRPGRHRAATTTERTTSLVREPLVGHGRTERTNRRPTRPHDHTHGRRDLSAPATADRRRRTRSRLALLSKRLTSLSMSDVTIFWIVVLVIAMVVIAGKRKSDDEANKQAQRRHEIFLDQQRVMLEQQEEINRLRREADAGKNDESDGD